MSYQVIARKWRPQTFEEVTGQENITRTLRNALEHDRLHHAYLFSGARGVGKTTTARLLAKTLNCHKTKVPNPIPCSASDATDCSSCTEISESRSIDVLEFDAASHTKVEEIRDIILEGINIAPARDRYKVFIIDEVHQLSNHSFNALLKTLEEPPPNVVFIMATTELHKVPETILSRCQEFEFRTIPLQKIFERLRLIAEAEKVDITDDALREISRSGEGSMRDAQSNFDQVISFSGEKIAVTDVSNALGMASVEMLTKVLSAVAEKNARDILLVVDDLIARGQDLRNFCRDLLSLLRDLLVFKIAGNAENLFETAILSRDEMRAHSANFSEADFLRFFNSVAETETRLKDATQTRYVLETGLIKLIEMGRVTAVEQLLERLSRIEQSLGGMPVESRAAPPISQIPEKKTLVSEPIPEKIEVTPVSASLPEEPSYFMEAPVDDFEESLPSVMAEEPALNNTKSFDLSFLDAIKLPLPSIDSAELEHVDDAWLDNAFEEKLLQSGDNLLPLASANSLVGLALSGSNGKAAESNGNGIAEVAPARDLSAYVPPVIDDGDYSEIMKLPENPTEEQLFAYANSLPTVKKALRIFRGKLVEVKKS
ncbi:MAG: DNA polymerase III subunit gamma/tau [Pyrinomonadaceae bacterium]